MRRNDPNRTVRIRPGAALSLSSCQISLVLKWDLSAPGRGRSHATVKDTLGVRKEPWSFSKTSADDVCIESSPWTTQLLTGKPCFKDCMRFADQLWGSEFCPAGICWCAVLVRPTNQNKSPSKIYSFMGPSVCIGPRLIIPG